MIEIEQRQLFNAELGHRGDCWKVCLASILELGYEDIPHFVQLEEDGEIPSHWNATIEFLRPHGLTIAQFGLWGDETPYLMFGNEKIRYHFHAPGHWIAGVVSKRTYPDGEHISHAVVMEGDKLAWDPHPLRADGHLGFTRAYLLVHT
jgi:hypothetical protein